MSIHLIQGFFFESVDVPHLGFDLHSDIAVFVDRAVVQSMFSGVIFDRQNSTVFGRLIDTYGDSILTDIQLDSSTFRFTKKYARRSDEIHYRFKKDGNVWVGSYEGNDVGRGLARCVLSEVPENFMDIPAVML